MNKITTLIGLSFAVFFLVGLATTLTRSMLITVVDVIPVYLLMGAAAPIKRYTGITSTTVISIDRVNVVARPTRKNTAKDKPINVVILFIKFLTFFF